MKLITNNKNLTYQRVFELFKEWLDDVSTTENLLTETSKGISIGAPSIYFWRAHLFGEFDIVFDDGVVCRDTYLTTSGAAVSLLYADKNCHRSDQSDPEHERDAQYITLTIYSGKMVLKEKPEHMERVFLSNELCSASFLFSKGACAQWLEVNGVKFENLSDINPNLICPAVSTFLSFITNVIEGGQDYKWLKHNRPYNDVWMKKPEATTSEE